jgi:hypothetical protein
MMIQDTNASIAPVITKGENLIKKFELEVIEQNRFRKIAVGVVKQCLVKVSVYYSNPNSGFKPSVVINNITNNTQIIKFK